ncbi:PDE2 [Candida pseudojiufengensis]|uniref:PDE2 n=1 Tax=Candida pseudojiufengensis TaxID=497109 RepID=UPI002224AC45|nr:PDE2 [Candida pseudojiufengensis]KAI5961205.1 PDE2 [Candida pseudojiufengensis]
MCEILSLIKDIPKIKLNSNRYPHKCEKEGHNKNHHSHKHNIENQKPQQLIQHYFSSFKLLIEHLFKKGNQETDINYPILIILKNDNNQEKSNYESLESLSYKEKLILLDYFFGHLNIIIIPHNHQDFKSLTKQLDSIIIQIYNRISRIGIWTGITTIDDECDVDKRIPTMNKLLIKNVSRSSQSTKNLIKLKNLIISEIEFLKLLGKHDSKHLAKLCHIVGNWSFTAHELTNDDLVYCVYLILNYSIKEVEKLKIEQTNENTNTNSNSNSNSTSKSNSYTKNLILPNSNELLAFIFILRDTYRSGNPFHNFRHAVDVLQACFYFLIRLGCLPQFKQFIINPLQSEFEIEKNLNFNINEEEIELISISKLFNSSFPSSSNSLTSSFSSSISLSSSSSTSDSITSNSSSVTVKQPQKPHLNSIQTLALLIAALGHDVGHPGTTNAFMIKNKAPTSLLYNDRSVLESYHASIYINKVLKILWPSLLITPIDEESLLNINDLIISSILATDMGEHFEYISKLKNFNQQINSYELNDIINKDNQIKLILALLIKCADISNVTRPLRISSQWAVILQREFDEVNNLDSYLNNLQNDENLTNFSKCCIIEDEEIIYPKLPFELSEILDNENTIIKISKGQMFFISTFAENLFNNISQVYPNLSFTCEIINNNKKFWSNEK